MNDSFPDAKSARQCLGILKDAMERYDTVTRVLIAQSVFGARIDQRITAMQELLGSLGEIQYAAEFIATGFKLPLDDYMVMVRGTGDPDPKLFYSDAVDEAPNGE